MRVDAARPLEEVLQRRVVASETRRMDSSHEAVQRNGVHGVAQGDDEGEQQEDSVVTRELREAVRLQAGKEGRQSVEGGCPTLL